jgi:membrane-associated phospholipid phosphatase
MNMLRLSISRHSFVCVLAIVATMTMVTATSARADEITDWNRTLFRAGLLAGTTPWVMTRNSAIVESAVFDAVNGIERRYAPVHVDPAGPTGASTRAAAVQAAYATLVQIYPPQKAFFDARRTASLAVIATRDDAAAIAAGVQWGQTVADAIIAWRSTDGFTTVLPPFLGGANPGEWRPTPPAFASGAGQQFSVMTPWVMSTPSQFRPAGPPALNSARYAMDFNEVKTMGSLTSTARTADQTVFALFWASTTVGYFWNATAVSLIERDHDRDRDGDGDADDRVWGWGHSHTPRRHPLLEHARLMAMLNLAMADAAIACWEAKYFYSFWRPVTAIQQGAADGNPATLADPNWTPLVVTPPFQDYVSGHSTISAAATVVLAGEFGDRTPFSVDSDALLGVERSFPSFSSALNEIMLARIYGGIHFRTACEDGKATGLAVGAFVREHALQPSAGPGTH